MINIYKGHIKKLLYSSLSIDEDLKFLKSILFFSPYGIKSNISLLDAIVSLKLIAVFTFSSNGIMSKVIIFSTELKRDTL